MIRIDITTEALQQSLAHLQRAGRDLRPVFKDIGEELVKSTHRRFEDGIGPDGKKWALNSVLSTLEYKEGDRPLIGETSRLATEIFYTADDHHLVVGSEAEYAAMQQFGGKKDDYPHLWGDIPARPFVGLSAADEQEALAIILEHLKTAAGL
jgi:phage virion morphogenesis (putative tail completion) protein